MGRAGQWPGMELNLRRHSNDSSYQIQHRMQSRHGRSMCLDVTRKCPGRSALLPFNPSLKRSTTTCITPGKLRSPSHPARNSARNVSGGGFIPTLCVTPCISNRGRRDGFDSNLTFPLVRERLTHGEVQCPRCHRQDDNRISRQRNIPACPPRDLRSHRTDHSGMFPPLSNLLRSRDPTRGRSRPHWPNCGEGHWRWKPWT
jgi:hypothetical protein